MTASRTSKVLALSLGQGLTTIVALVSGMVMARILSQTELATYRQTMLAYDVALPLLSLGISSGIYYFLPTEKIRARGVVVDGLVMMFTMGLLYAVFIALGGNHLLAKRFSNPAIVNTLVYLVPLPMIMLPAGLLASVMVVQNQVNKLTVYNVLSSLLMATSVIAACLLWRTPESMVIVRVCISVAMGLIAIFLMLKAVPKDDWLPRLSNMKTMVAFSIPLVLAGAIGTISLQLDKIIVSSMCSPQDFAVYSTGALEIPLIGIITGSIASVILPDLRRMVAAGDNVAALGLFRQAATRSAAFLIPTMMFLLVSAESFILTLFSSKYSGSVLPFSLYLLILPIRIANYGSFQTALGLTKTIMWRAACGLMVNLILSIILVGRFGYIGAIIATIITLYGVNSTINMAVISKATSCRWWQVLPFRTVFSLLWATTLAAIPVLIMSSLKIEMPPLAALILNAGVYGLMLVGVAWFFKIQPLQAEMRLVRAKLRSALGISGNP